MATRFIKSSIWTSPNLNELSDEAELLFYRLLPLPDDHGCFLADPRVLKGIVFPLKSLWSIDVICRQLTALADNGALKLWVKDGRLYGMFPNWSKHQRIRSLFHRKTPEPPDNFDNDCQNAVCKLLSSIAVNSQQIDASLPPSPFPLPSSNNIMSSKLKKEPKTDPLDPVIDKILTDLNEKAGTNYRLSTEGHRKHIRARLKEGHTLENFLFVNQNQVAKWGNDPKMADYLRPKTLYNSDNFDNYLNATIPEERPPEKQLKVWNEKPQGT